MRSALSLHAGRGSLAIVDASAFHEPETRRARELLEDWGHAGPTLVALGDGESAAARSFRNLARVSVRSAEQVGVSDLVGAASVVFSEQSLKQLSARALAGAGD